jgi:membrane associated rhomboid family serine protease
MDDTHQHPATAEGLAEAEEEVVYCHGHPDTPTKLRCSRCDKPICGRCAVPAAVGQHCVWCVAEARKSAPKVRSALQKNSPAVMVIIGLSVAVYALEIIFGLNLRPSQLNPVLERFGEIPANIVFNGEYYRLITPMFLHAPLGEPFGLLHILFNMYILRIYGPQVEGRFGTLRFSLMYLLTGFVAAAASMAFGSCGQIGIGASGAVFGVVGILLVVLYNRRHQSHVNDYLRTLLMFVGINLLLGFSLGGIDNFAHMGGLAAGIAVGIGTDKGREGDASTYQQVATMLVVGLAGLLLVAWRVSSMPAICEAFVR